MTKNGGKFPTASTQIGRQEASNAHLAIPRKCHTASLAHECCENNGCAGLNPAAYRQVVEALKVLNALVADYCNKFDGQVEGARNLAKQALTAAQETTT